jgi:hypothetical protein
MKPSTAVIIPARNAEATLADALDQAFGLPEVLVAVSTSRLSCKRAGKTRALMPVWDSSGESRLIMCRVDVDMSRQ